jgi:hypothetical protein
MSLIDRIFGRPAPVKPPVEAASQQGPAATRRELLRVVLRDTLKLHGLPADWIAAELLTSGSRDGKQGIHMRLLLKHWEPRLLVHAPALQDSVSSRLKVFDPLAGHWFTGISWQFALADASGCPPMPATSFWTAPVAVPPAVRDIQGMQDVQDVDDMLPTPSPLLQSSQPTAAERRAALEQLLAEGDRERGALDRDRPPGFEATQPAFQATEPAGL